MVAEDEVQDTTAGVEPKDSSREARGVLARGFGGLARQVRAPASRVEIPVAPGYVCWLLADQKMPKKGRFPKPAKSSCGLPHFVDVSGEI